jgi:hypothetical protein
MVNSMEEFWKKDPELTFHQVKKYAEDQFGRNGFKAIEKERSQFFKKKFDKKMRIMVADYLKVSKIVGILFAFVAFKVSFYFDNPSKYYLYCSRLLLFSFNDLFMDNESQD